MCENIDSLFTTAVARDIDCPVRLYPACHPNAHIEAFIEHKTHRVLLCCSVCERLVVPITASKRRKKSAKLDPTGTP